MKNILITLCCIVLVTSLATAQLSFGGGAHVGFAFSSFPTAVKDYYGSGFLFGGHGELNIIKYVTVRLNLDYVSFTSDKTKIAQALATKYNVQASDIVFSGLNTSDFSIFVNGLGKIPIQGSPVTPYGLLGFGLNFLSGSDGTFTYQGTPQTALTLKGESSTKFGLNFGGGSEYAIAKAMKLILEFKYVIVFTEGSSTSYFPIVLGATFTP
jgi:opacity protein-like surface antigen